MARLTPKLKLLFKKIAQRNKSFQKMTRAQKKVEVAKDVLALLEAKYLRPVSANTYVQTNGKCTVCGIGALVVAKTIKKEEQVEDISRDERDVAVKQLKGIFTPTELVRIEQVFENISLNSFSSLFADDEDKLAVMMQIIVDGKGNVKFPEAPDAYGCVDPNCNFSDCAASREKPEYKEYQKKWEKFKSEVQSKYVP